MINFEKPDYLKHGNALQQKAYRLLDDHRIFEKLKQFDPILTGTIPIDIAIASSDLDIICCWAAAVDFKQSLALHFSGEKDFELREATINGEETIIANFKIDGFELEVFGQAVPTRRQNAYRHMLVEHQILVAKGEAFRQQIVELKNKGYKTEPAFAKLLELDGDPYEALLSFTVYKELNGRWKKEDGKWNE